MKTNISYIIFALLALFTACTDDDSLDTLSAEQRQLIGRAVNFDASIADAFSTRATYVNDGSFNEGDIITIYRQYSEDGKTFADTKDYRVYNFHAKTVAGTNIQINTEWKVMVGKKGYDPEREEGERLFIQTEADSLTWDNGNTVRFRAWGMSNLSGCLSSTAIIDNFYPDFTVSNWVTASGPTNGIPLSMRHLGCRIMVSPYGGNELLKVELSTDPKDYQRKDNADTPEDDINDKLPNGESNNGEPVEEILTAEKAAAGVKAVYEKMCMPGGVDFDYGLRAMSNEAKESLKNSEGKYLINGIETEEVQAKMIAFSSCSAEDIKTNAVRPGFVNNNGYRYLITIPHDMSSNNAGERLTLPPYTRFRVYLRDINNGDDHNNPDAESKYHLISLSDIKDANGNKLFEAGMPMIAGYSYNLTVGYDYEEFKIIADNNFSWKEISDSKDAGKNDGTIAESQSPYKWWKDAIQKAIDNVASQSYNPDFHISNATEFLEFVNLVNGTTAPSGGLPYQLVQKAVVITDSEGNKKTEKRWFKTDSEGNVTDEEVSETDAEKDGFIFYSEYRPRIGDNPERIDRVYLKGPYSFYSALVKTKFKVTIDKDIDLDDVPLATIGADKTTPFLGILDGNCHTLRNIYMKNGYLFDNIGIPNDEYPDDAAYGAVVSNMILKSEHNLCVVNKGQKVRLIGLALRAPSTKAAFAEELTGALADNFLVGCINEGDAKDGLVGKATGLTMYGCMQTATGIDAGALLGQYAEGKTNEFFAPAKSPVTWGNFMCNFYDIDRSPKAVAVGGQKYEYEQQQYIRGLKTYMMKAKDDNLVSRKDEWNKITNAEQRKGFYGLAPWKAMNYAIERYNTGSPNGSLYPCKFWFEVDSGTGFDNRYPFFTSTKPTIEGSWNVLNAVN